MTEALEKWHAPDCAEQIARRVLSETVPRYSIPPKQASSPHWQHDSTRDCTHIDGGEEVFEELRKRLAPTTLLRRDEPLAKRTTLRVGGPAEIYVEPASEEDLAAELEFCNAHRCRHAARPRLESAHSRRRHSRRGHPSCASVLSRIELVDGNLRCGAGASLKNVADRRHVETSSPAGIFGRHSGQRRRRAAHECRRDGQRDVSRRRDDSLHGSARNRRRCAGIVDSSRVSPVQLFQDAHRAFRDARGRARQTSESRN